MRLPSISFGWYQRLSRRERLLTLAVAGTVFVIVNLVAISFLLDTYTRLSREFTRDRGTVLLLRGLANQQEMWKQRSAWLHATQPVLINRDRAGTALYEQIQGLGRATQLIVTSLQIKPAATVAPGAASREPADAPQVVSVEAETQGDWKNTVHFLTDVQKPENFLVFELASLHSDPADAKQMKGHFLISKWYAPAGK
jgi:hypothetical protein